MGEGAVHIDGSSPGAVDETLKRAGVGAAGLSPAISEFCNDPSMPLPGRKHVLAPVTRPSSSPQQCHWNLADPRNSKKNFWSELLGVGTEEVYELVFGKTTDQTVRSVAELLGPAMSAAVGSTPNMAAEEIELLTPSLSLFNSDTQLSKYLADLRLYMEACITAAQDKSGIVQFLVTDDHKFLRHSSRASWQNQSCKRR